MWEICGKTGTGNIVFFVYFLVVWGFRAARFCCCLCHVSDTSAEPQRSLYIYTRPQTDCRGQVQPRANQCTRTYIYMYINTDVLNMRLHLVEIYQNTERSKTFKNTTCSTYHRTCPTYSVRSISRISLLMLLISISSVTGLISKKHLVYLVLKIL